MNQDRDSTREIQFNNKIIYEHLISDNQKFFHDLKQKYENIKISIKSEKSRKLILNGDLEEIEEAANEIRAYSQNSIFKIINSNSRKLNFFIDLI